MDQEPYGNPRRFRKGLENPHSYGGQHFLRVKFRACFLNLSNSFMDELSQISHSIRGLSSSVPFRPSLSHLDFDLDLDVDMDYPARREISRDGMHFVEGS